MTFHGGTEHSSLWWVRAFARCEQFAWRKLFVGPKAEERAWAWVGAAGRYFETLQKEAA